MRKWGIDIMAKMAELLGGTKRQDLLRVANNEKVPYRGRKKHFTQMSQHENRYLLDSLKDVDKWTMERHALDRIIEKEIDATYEDAVSTIHNGKIIEYHIAKHREEKDARVLLRANALVNGTYNLNVVYSLTRKSIVSVWINDIKDKHSTLDMNAYNRGLKII